MIKYNDNGKELVQPDISIKAMLVEEGYSQFPAEFCNDLRADESKVTKIIAEKNTI
jgi:hypothetical protein